MSEVTGNFTDLRVLSRTEIPYSKMLHPSGKTTSINRIFRSTVTVTARAIFARMPTIRAPLRLLYGIRALAPFDGSDVEDRIATKGDCEGPPTAAGGHSPISGFARSGVEPLHRKCP